MRYGKVLTLIFAGFFCFTLCANAQLGVGAAVKGATGVTGNLPTWPVAGTVDSTTQMTGDLQNGVNGNVNSTSAATTKAKKRKQRENGKHEKSGRAKAAYRSSNHAGPSSTQSKDAAHDGSNRRSARVEAGAGIDAQTSANADVAGTSAGAGVKSSSRADAAAEMLRRNGNARTDADSSNTTATKVERPRKSQKDPFTPER